jgi:hypothetical protein
MIVFGNEGAALVGPACDFCGEPRVGDGLVVWMLATGAAVVVHGPCAVQLGVHLVQDARELQLAEGDHPWPQRAAWAAGRALRRAEHKEVVPDERRA